MQENINTLTKKLFIAIQNENLDEAKKLIKLGANVNAKDNHGLTVLMHAVQAGDWRSNFTSILLDNGADVFAKDEEGKTAYDYIVEPPKPPLKHENAYEMWVHCPEHCAMNVINIHIRDLAFGAIHGGDFSKLEALLEKGVSTEISDFKMRTLLMLAVRATNNKFELTKVLVKHGADVLATDYDENTVLDHLILSQEPDKSDKKLYEEWLKSDECKTRQFLIQIINEKRKHDRKNGGISPAAKNSPEK